jgi:hypothetical protein
MSRRNTFRFDYCAFAHRLRVARIAVAISDVEAASVAGCTVQTWRKYETTGKGRCTRAMLFFCRRYDVSLDWLFLGEGVGVGGHLGKQAQGKVAILPVKGPRYRRAMAMGSV